MGRLLLRATTAGLYRKASSGAGAEALIAATGPGTYPRDWSLDGRFLLYETGPAGTMSALPMEGDHTPVRYPPSQPSGSQVTSGHFSADGHRVAYVSDETGRPEIFVQDFRPAARSFRSPSPAGRNPAGAATEGSCISSPPTGG